MLEVERWRYFSQRASEPVLETTMKKHFNLLNVFRTTMVAAAALALYLPAMNMPQKTEMVTAQAQKLPEGIRLASAQASWHAVSALAY